MLKTQLKTLKGVYFALILQNVKLTLQKIQNNFRKQNAAKANSFYRISFFILLIRQNQRMFSAARLRRHAFQDMSNT